MTEQILQSIADDIAAGVNAGLSSFEGFDVRADAGEPGVVYVAMREARGEAEAGERLAKRLTDLVEEAVEESDERLDFALAMGRGDEDLLLRVEIHRVCP